VDEKWRLTVESLKCSEMIALSRQYQDLAWRDGLVGQDIREAWSDLEKQVCRFTTAWTRNVFLPQLASLNSWSTVEAVARTIDHERCFQDLPILADALEEAGCTDDEGRKVPGQKKEKNGKDGFRREFLRGKHPDWVNLS
jgi:hypothetical protein